VIRAAVLPSCRRPSLHVLTLCAALIAIGTGFSSGVTAPATSGASLEDRKQPMRFGWVACEPGCGGYISAVGIVTGDTPMEFEEFARGRRLDGTTVVLDSSGGSVNDAITLGRRWRGLKLSTTVGSASTAPAGGGVRLAVAPHAYCESMCVFLLLSGTNRYVPAGAHVRVHQIWMGDRAEDARAATYSAQDLTIVERDIGRLAKYTFDMGGTGDLLSLALSVPPWEELHELSARELIDTNLITTQAVADVLPQASPATKAVADAKPAPDRFEPATPRPRTSASQAAAHQPAPPDAALRATQTAEAVPTGGMAQPVQPPVKPAH
jgi:hypothetical protein